MSEPEEIEAEVIEDSSLARRRHLLPIPLACGVLASVLALVVAIAARASLGGWVWALVVIAILGLVGAAFSWRRLTHEELEIQAERDGLDGIRGELEEEMAVMERRRQKFERRLLTYGEWMEFPENDLPTIPDDPAECEEVKAQDEAVARLVKTYSEEILTKFRGDDFREDGKFQPQLLVSEVTGFVEEIAKIYQPGVQDALLQTNVEKLLQAVNRLSMQLLFQLEQLPLNLKDYSLAKAAEHVRTASRFHGYYQKLTPYMPIANYTWQLGRIVAGATPVSAGALFLGSEALRKGGKKMGKHYFERYSLKLTQEAVRLVGNEAATVFDPAYRYRDSAWIYGVELAELVHTFAPSIDTLQEALRQVGSLPLRGSYDRVFLYRCIAAHGSPEPGKFDARLHLSPGERHNIARRLEQFYSLHVHGRNPARTDRWSKGVEERLGAALKVTATNREIAPADQARSMVDSLAGFLIEIKGRDFDEVLPIVAKTESWELLRGLGKLPADNSDEDGGTPWPSLFDYPDLAPDSANLGVFFKDLVTMEKDAGGIDPGAFAAIGEASRFLGAPTETVEATLASIYAKHMGAELPKDSGEATLPTELAVPMTLLLGPETKIDFVYPTKIQAPRGELRKSPLAGAKIWLIGDEDSLWAIALPAAKTGGAGAGATLAWLARPETKDSGSEKGATAKTSLDGTSLVLDGGSWHVPFDGATLSVSIPNKRTDGLHYFRALRASGAVHEG